MAAGKKRYRITIQRLKTEAEGLTLQTSGKADLTDNDNWTEHAKRWAELIEPAGREWQQEGQVRAEESFLILVDWDSVTKTTTTEMRILWPDGGTDRILDITRIGGRSRSESGPRWQLVIEAKEHA